jgi:UDP-2,4-diacetamido-2,4,6-trideoxy-beta-L-altropyranose hydrolase
MQVVAEGPDILFRTDASDQIGAGHVMRCLALAEELRDFGMKSLFVCRAHEGHMAAHIRKQGHQLILLPLERDLIVADSIETGFIYAAWLGATWQRDAHQAARAIVRKQLRWVIVDHYAIDARWERRVKEATGAKVMAIDGLANRVHDCELLLDPTCSARGKARWAGLLPTGCLLLVGPQFALLRPEFAIAKRKIRHKDGAVRRIFIGFGGVDACNATQMALEAFEGLCGPDLALDVVIAAANPHRFRLLEKYQGSVGICLHVQPARMADLMANADLAVGAGGTMLIEQCFMELPTVVCSIAANQVSAAKGLDERGAVQYIGAFEIGKPDEMKQRVRQRVLQLLSEPSRLANMRSSCRQLMMKPDKALSQILIDLSHETH